MPNQRVFLDANVVIQAGKPPGGPIISRVRDLVKAGLVTVLTTDLTVDEVAKKHAQNDYDVIKEVGRPHFRKILHEHLGVNLPDVTKEALRESCWSKYAKLTKEMFEDLKATTLSIDDVKPSVVFDSYKAQQGLFSGEGKKDQFPDAFIFERLKLVASAKSPVIIVSDDGDFDFPAQGVDHVSVLKSISELFEHLGLEVDEPAVEELLEEKKHDELLVLVDKELNDWGLQVSDVEDAEIEEISVKEIELNDLVSFRSTEKGDNILVIGTVEITADVSYQHPDWDHAMWDSEDKRLIPFEDVSGEKEIVFEADFSMSVSVDEEGKPGDIEEFQFRNGEFQWVELHPHDPYEYR